MDHQLAITRGEAFVAFSRNAKAIKLPDGRAVLGPLDLSTLPHLAGDYAIRRVVVDGPMPGSLEIGVTEPPVVDGDVVLVRRTVAPMPAEMVGGMLAQARADAVAQVDAAAEAARLRFVTPGSAQAMVYQQKAAEARDHRAGGTGPWPHLEAEVGITGATVEDVAGVVLEMEAAWLAISAQIERARLSAKAAIADAATLAEVEAVLAALEWPAP